MRTTKGPGDPPKFGVAKNLLQILGSYGKTRQEAEQDPYYEDRLDVTKEDVYSFILDNLVDSMTEEGVFGMKNQMGKVRLLGTDEPRHPNLEGRAYFDPNNNTVNLKSLSEDSSFTRGSSEGEEYTHSIQNADQFDKYNEQGKDYRSGQEMDRPLIKELADIISNPSGGYPRGVFEWNTIPSGYFKGRKRLNVADRDVFSLTDPLYYDGEYSQKEFEGMMVPGLILAKKMGLIGDEKVDKYDIPDIIDRYNSLVAKRPDEDAVDGMNWFQAVPRHARNLIAVMQTLYDRSFEEPEALDALVNFLNQNVHMNDELYPDLVKKQNGGRVIKYNNGGKGPGDPIRKEEQLAFAQLLRDQELNRKLEEKNTLREQYGVYADDPAGIPSIDPGLVFSPAGDVEAIGSGVGQIASGDVGAGSGNVALGILSLLLPGSLPKIPIDEAVRVARSPRSRVTSTGGSPGDPPIYRNTDGVLDPVLNEITQTGKEFDRMGVGINPDVNYSIEDIGEVSGRKIVRVRAEDGTSQLFYKSTGGGGKLMPDGKSTAGMWQPFGGITDGRTIGLPDGWFIKGTKGVRGLEHGFEDYYGSESFRALSNQIDDEFAALAANQKKSNGGRVIKYNNGGKGPQFVQEGEVSKPPLDERIYEEVMRYLDSAPLEGWHRAEDMVDPETSPRFDALRHMLATSETVQELKEDRGYPAPLAMLAANLFGLGHEIKNFHGVRSAAEDLFNNFVGSIPATVSDDPEKIEQMIKMLSYFTPDGKDKTDEEYQR